MLHLCPCLGALPRVPGSREGEVAGPGIGVNLSEL